jgi:hypothetical protein
MTARNDFLLCSRKAVNKCFPYMKLKLGVFHITYTIFGFLKNGLEDDIRSAMAPLSPLYKNIL